MTHILSCQAHIGRAEGGGRGLVKGIQGHVVHQLEDLHHAHQRHRELGRGADVREKQNCKNFLPKYKDTNEFIYEC